MGSLKRKTILDFSSKQHWLFCSKGKNSHINFIHYILNDRDGHGYELRYIRDKEGREVDFAILKEGVLEELVELNHADETI